MQVDLPAFERPTKAISGTLTGGSWCSCAAVVKKARGVQPAHGSLGVGHRGCGGDGGGRGRGSLWGGRFDGHG